jgi:hypothetical protein
MEIYPESIEDWPSVNTYGNDFRGALLRMAQATTELGLWDFFRTYSPHENKGFMFEDSQEMERLDVHPSVDRDGHSGATSAYAKRCMQLIAREGFDEFKQKCR